MKRVGKSNARSEGRAGLFFIDTSQKKIILFSSLTKSEGQATSKHVDFRLKERMPTYTRVGNMDSTNVKIFSVVAESFEKK